MARVYYREFYDELISISANHYRDSDIRYFGTKEAWTESFVKPMSRIYPEMKFIFIIRDPRSVIASKNINDDKQPLLFLIRQWRESVQYILHYTMHDLAADKAIYVQYEDLVTKPKEVGAKMCDFLGVPFDEVMVTGEKFIDGVKDKWNENSSFEDAGKGIYTSSLHRWKKTLSKKVLQAIETLCKPEMQLIGYEATQTHLPVIEQMNRFPEVDPETLTQWAISLNIAKHLFSNDSMVEALQDEVIRANLLTLTSVSSDATQQVINKYFITDEYYQLLKSV